MPTLLYKKLAPTAVSPFIVDPDQVAVFAHLLTESGRPNNRILPPHSTRAIPTGLSLYTTPHHGYVYAGTPSPLFPFSTLVIGTSLGLSLDLTSSRGDELFIYLYNGSTDPYYVRHEDQLARLLFLPWTPIHLQEVETFQ